MVEQASRDQDIEAVAVVAGAAGGRPQLPPDGLKDHEEATPSELDDDAYFASSHKSSHASIRSFFMRLLPNRMGSTHSFFWEAFMWILEIPPILENNIHRKVKELMQKKRLPGPKEVPGIAQALLYTPHLACKRWAVGYFKRKDLWVPDLMTGLTVGVMLIPQSMAYALLANMPPITGMYTAVIAPIIYAILGTSNHLSIGPTSLISLYFPTAMTMVGVTSEHFPDDPHLDAETRALRMSLAPVLMFWVGVIYCIFSITRAANLIKFLSHSVITGFTSAAGLYIAISQLKYILGVHLSGEFTYNYQLYQFYHSHGIKQGNKVTQQIGGLSFLFMYLEKLVKRIFPPTPRRMANKWYRRYKTVATFTTIFVVFITACITKGLYDRGIKIPIVGTLPKGYPPVRGPELNAWPASKVINAALPLAILGYMEAYSVSRKYALQFKYTVEPDQDLFALGIGNLLGSCFSSYPSGGNFSRTSLAAILGQKTPFANVVLALFISLVLVSLLPALYYIPFACLGAVVCNAVVSLVDWPEIIKAMFLSPLDCLVMLVTFFTTLFVSISDGLGWGLVASVVCLFYKLSQVETVPLGRRSEDDQFVAIRIYPEAAEDEKIKVLRISGRLAFMNAAQLRDRLFLFVEGEQKHRDIVFDCAGVSSIDLTAIITLTDIVLEADKHDISLWFANCCKQLKSNLTMCGLIERLGGEELCVKTVEEVYDHAKMARIEADAKPKPVRRQVDTHGH